jgi:hypothetical protein
MKTFMTDILEKAHQILSSNNFSGLDYTFWQQLEVFFLILLGDS